jgi:hypothetical protein
MNTRTHHNLSSIHFKSSMALADFLAAFIGTGSTAIFEVSDLGNGQFTLTFTGAF